MSSAPSSPGTRVLVDLWTASFCGACSAARAAVGEARRLVPALEIVERDVATAPDAAGTAGITSTPTIVVTAPDGREVFRSAGVPRVEQVLAAVALGL